MPPSTPAGKEDDQARFVSWLARHGVRASFWWGFAEAILFFIVPDVIVGAAALFHPRKWLRAAAAAVIGSLIGGVVLYAATVVATDQVREVVAAVPAVSPSMINEVRDGLNTDGGFALLRAPLSGIPYKLYVTEMGAETWNLVVLLLWSVPARALRIVPVALGAAAIGQVLRRYVARYPSAALAAYGAIWVGVYVAYFSANGF